MELTHKFQDLNEDSPKIQQPHDLNIELMEHQKAIVYSMIELENCQTVNVDKVIYYGYRNPKSIQINTSLGILGDAVGSGKSYEIISLLLMNSDIKKLVMPLEGFPFISVSEITKNAVINTNLLIVPPQIINQWINFFKNAPTLKLYVCNNINDISKIVPFADYSYDVIIVNSTMLKNFSASVTLSGVMWKRIIIDEADTIKIPKTFEILASFVWLITGTSDGLLFNAKNYMSKFFRKTNGWLYKFLTIHTDATYLEGSLKLPTPFRTITKCMTPLELQVVKDFIPSNVVSLINAGNIDSAIKALNCNKDTDKNILQIITHNIKIAIKNKEIELEAEKKKTYKGNQLIEQEKRIKHIEHIITRLKNKESGIKEKIYTINDNYCPICMGEFNNPVLLKCCQNIFCFECLMLASHKISNTCPYCKQKIIEQNMMIITNHSNTNNEQNKQLHVEKDKLDVLLEIINTKKNKIIVFANFDETIDKIENLLTKHLIRFSKMTYGNVTNIINGFSHGEISVLLLNAKFYAAGMNLQMTNDIIIFHRFTKEIETQVIGRAQRIGRTEPLTVHYLIHSNEAVPLESNTFNDVDYFDWLENDVGTNVVSSTNGTNDSVGNKIIKV